MLGSTLSYGTTDGDYYLVKTDTLGNKLWHKTYGGAGEERGYSIDITSDNGLILGGGSDKFPSKPYAPWIIKTDSSGNIEWDKQHGTRFGTDCGATSINALSDGGYLVVGCIDTFGLPLPTGYVDQIVKTNASGNIIWRKVLDQTAQIIIRRAQELNDGSLLFAGEIPNTQEGRITGWLLKLDADGNLQWERMPSYTHSGRPFQSSCRFWDFTETSDGGILCVGSAFGNSNSSLFWFVKLDSMGCEVSGCHVGINEQKQVAGEVFIYPNPATNQIFVSIKSANQKHAFKQAVLKIYNVAGKEIYTQTTTLNTSAYSEYYINISQFENGIYFYTVTTENEIIGKGRIIKH
jgi:hypothetical protein